MTKETISPQNLGTRDTTILTYERKLPKTQMDDKIRRKTDNEGMTVLQSLEAISPKYLSTSWILGKAAQKKKQKI